MPRLVDPEARRATINAAVVDIVGESGFAAVTMRAVADRIGASTSAVTHYVESRDDLLRVAVRGEVDRRISEADEVIGARSGAEGLRALLDWALIGRSQTAHRFWLAAIVAAADQAVVATELARFNEWWSARVRGFLADTAVRDVDASADLIGVLVDGLIINGFYGDAPTTSARRAQILDLVWSALDL